MGALNTSCSCIYYNEARGMPRDQPRALQLFERAAAAGSADGLCGAAAMYLKGEGTANSAKNTSRAIDLYETAASMGSVKALNGLGYMFFFGQEVDKNEVCVDTVCT